MASGWFKAFSDFAKSGQKALDRYTQLHQMDEENQIKRRQLQMQEEQFRQQGEGFRTSQETAKLQQSQLRNALYKQDADELTTNLVPGQKLSPELASKVQQHPELAGRFNVTPPSTGLTQPSAFTGVDFMPQPTPQSTLQRAILPSFAPDKQAADTSLKGSISASDLFGHPLAESPLKPVQSEGSTTYLGTPQSIDHQRQLDAAIAQLPEEAQKVARVQAAGLPGFSLSDFQFRPTSVTGGTDTSKLIRSEAIRLGYRDEIDMMQKDPEKYQAAFEKAKLAGKPKPLTQADYTPEEIAGMGGMIAQGITLPGGLLTRMDNDLRNKLIKSALSVYGKMDVANLRAQTTADAASLKGLTILKDRLGAYEGTTEDNLKLMISAADRIPNLGTMTLNEYARKVAQEFGSPDTVQWYESLAAGLTEYAAITQNPNLTGVLADAARKRISELVPPGATPEQTAAAVQQMISQMGNRARNLDSQIEQVNLRSNARHQAILQQVGGGGNSGNTPEAPHTAGDGTSTVTSDRNGNPSGEVLWGLVGGQLVRVDAQGKPIKK